MHSIISHTHIHSPTDGFTLPGEIAPRRALSGIGKGTRNRTYTYYGYEVALFSVLKV